ncbi:hypothetical protein D8674_038249 [Pyrus ussuriensis x Pyrus communis]|uniref:Uncharacterized protein n=1 Tax=Pyrus ussuriensis x Pyrus communis TaxID=2448454 RepID=A0A5N5I623_9ROSA|nr:hypothetical protein D8674_038249 [Pyrus ussuriensis x Pyrus communis]
MDSFGKLGQSLGVIEEHVLMSSISDLNEIAHDDEMIDTSMAIIPFVENNDVIMDQQGMKNDLEGVQGNNKARLMPLARSGEPQVAYPINVGQLNAPTPIRE